MITRSVVSKKEVNIDFCEAIEGWEQNKKKMKNGCYVYICNYPLPNGKLCSSRSVLNRNICSYEYCKKHQKYYTYPN